MELLEENLQKSPVLRAKFTQERSHLRQSVAHKAENGLRTEATGTVTIPIVFHIVLSNQSLVTNQQLLAQLDTLNKDFGGTNGDSTKVPSYFKSLFGKTKIQFCLAQRTPDDLPTTGIVRYNTNRTSFSTNNNVKHASTGGADAWNTDKYLNVWVCNLSNDILGYATFPETGTATEQGVVVHYNSLPGSSLPQYGKGKTLVHETGHFFYLFHIWGDDDGSCTGSDDVDDTPNQANATQGCPTGVSKDNCNQTNSGVMYQNFMDYSYDDCLVMFTTAQVARMETALTQYRSSLIASNACVPLNLKNLDAQVRAIIEPDSRVCATTILPKVVIRNNGSQTLNSVVIKARIEDRIVSYTYSGNLNYGASDTVSLPQLQVNTGAQLLNVYVTELNAATDEDHSNDSLSRVVSYYPPVTSVSESFEGNVFPPEAWDIVNTDNSYTWEKTSDAAKTGQYSVVMKNYGYGENDKKDYLRLPLLDLSNADSAFVSFEVAAAVQTAPSTSINAWDTLEVLISTDCGKTYTSLYKKWGSSLVTRQTPTTQSFIPTANEWRKDSVNLSAYIPFGQVMVAFLNTTEYENNIFLDDVNVRKIVVNPNLKKTGFLVTPSPGSGIISVDFYPQPTTLKAIAIYNTSGQLITSRKIADGAASNHYQFDLTSQASGVYFVRVVFNDQVLVKKIIKI